MKFVKLGATMYAVDGKDHVGEVQVSVWDEQTLEGCHQAGIELL